MIRVYRYGLLAPTMNGALVREQMRGANQYRNVLVEIECARRSALRTLLTDNGLRQLEEEVAAAEASVQTAVAAAREVRSSARSAASVTARHRVREARETRRRAVDALRARRREIRDSAAVQRAMSEINERAASLRRSARGLCGVYWGTYLLVEDADHRARAAALYDGALPNNPRCLRFFGSGRIGVQIQRGIPCAVLFGSDARLRVAPVDPGAWQSPERAERRRLSRTVLSLRIGSEGRSPIWAQWPMTMHRPLPEGSIVKRATVSVHRRGPREEWSVEITLEVPDDSFVGSRANQANGTGSVVAIDIGWRAMGGELRVAAWAGSDGRSGELVLPESLVGAFVKVEELHSIRDQNFTAARQGLEAWLTGFAAIPDWLHDASDSIAEWRHPSRLAALAKKWKGLRFAGDEQAFEALEAWRYHDHHLWSWEASQRINALRARREIYRVFASRLVRTYASIILENFDFRSTAESRLSDDVRTSSRGSRRDRQIAAVSELRAILQNASAGRSVGIEMLDATGAADSADSACPPCSSKEFDTAGQLHGACDPCDSVWDSHENAARGLLARWQRECRGIDSPRAGVSSEQMPESRWVRARRLRAEKDAGADRAAECKAKHKAV
ncbi:MAG: hypothetical protein FWD73_13610 [Polyangiaceae bacterium]|nr:hypothetical protein [Polyangiaceae bacterium]